MSEVTIDTSGFSRYVNALKQQFTALGHETSLAKVVESEVASVISQCIRYQNVNRPSKSDSVARQATKIRSKFNTFNSGGAGSVPWRAGSNIYQPAESGERLYLSDRTSRIWVGKPGKWYIMNGDRRWSNAR